ncbi:MAG: glycosyltransferase, partial [Anaerolineae bacterium]
AGPGVTTAPYLLDVRGAQRVVEDLEISMIRAKAEAARSPLLRLRYRLTWRKQRRYTRELLRQIDGCTVSSDLERAAVLDVAPDGRPVAVVPNGVDLERYRGDFGPVEPDTLVFPGALTYEANFEAMRFFLGEIFPRIRRARLQATLYITGRTDGVDLGRLRLGGGVVLTGYLPDVRPRVARSAVCIAPLTLGGGTRIKILEAMALGTPVVATSKGAEGLEVTPGRDLLIADDPESFAGAVVRVLEDADLRAALSAAGRRRVAERYDWKVIGQQLNAFLERVYHEGTKSIG